MGSYHWTFIVGPKAESESSRGYRFHAKEKISFIGNPPVAKSLWHYEELEVPLIPDSMLLVRVMIGKVKEMEQLRSIFQDTPIRPEIEGWNCVEWIKESFIKVIQDGKALGRCATSWEEVRDTAMCYVADKKASHRFDGTVSYDSTLVPTWDMLAGAELIS